jgi:hypothetical protein
MRCLFHSIGTDVIPWHFRGVWPSIIRMHPQLVRPCSPGLRPPIWDYDQDIICIILCIELRPFGRASRTRNPIGFHTTVSINFGDWTVCRSLSTTISLEAVHIRSCPLNK